MTLLTYYLLYSGNAGVGLILMTDGFKRNTQHESMKSFRKAIHQMTVNK